MPAGPPRRSTANIVLRVIGVLLLTAVSWLAALVAWVIGMIQSSGCFIECSPGTDSPNTVTGTLAFVAAAALVIAPFVVGYFSLRPRR